MDLTSWPPSIHPHTHTHSKDSPQGYPNIFNDDHPFSSIARLFLLFLTDCVIPVLSSVENKTGAALSDRRANKAVSMSTMKYRQGSGMGLYYYLYPRPWFLAFTFRYYNGNAALWSNRRLLASIFALRLLRSTIYCCLHRFQWSSLIHLLAWKVLVCLSNLWFPVTTSAHFVNLIKW